ncbi:VWA domain-containing protein [Frigidibacter sp. MR17.14]|uniref:VWA domain-containing protein n=1 Tax=Frigidibacter sp. MR17.14 TaxID=3126509 RepID=UPI0030131DDC
MQFDAPLLFLLLPLPVLLWRVLPPRADLQGAVYLPSSLAPRSETAATRDPATRSEIVLAALLWAALVTALAGPERLTLERNSSASGRDILLALDMSGSMLTEDFTLDGQQVSRLDAVKTVAGAFAAGREGDRLGLVLFADRAYVAAPLSHDLAAVGRAIEEASVGVTGRSTAIGEGLGLALKRLDEGGAESRAIVLLSDGRDSGKRLDARDVARLAAAHGVRVHTVALGPDDMETRPAARDAVDVAMLREIAAAAGGESWRVRRTEDLRAMAQALDRLEPNPSRRPPVVVPRPAWTWPAGLALVAALVLALGRAGLPGFRRAVA